MWIVHYNANASVESENRRTGSVRGMGFLEIFCHRLGRVGQLNFRGYVLAFLFRFFFSKRQFPLKKPPLSTGREETEALRSENEADRFAVGVSGWGDTGKLLGWLIACVSHFSRRFSQAIQATRAALRAWVCCWWSDAAVHGRIAGLCACARVNA